MPPSGKKAQVKKEEQHTVPSEEFDGVIVESEVLLTLLPLLESKEQQVLLKTCSTLAEFARYSELNKHFLLDATQNTIVCKLSKLLHHDDSNVRLVVLQILTALLELDYAVKLAVCLGDEFLTQLISFLSHTGENSMKLMEMALQCLCRMSVRYGVKASVTRLDGIPALIRCLSVNNPDIQLHALRTITLIMEDYRASKAVRDQNGLTLILQLALTSPYPTIQCCALQNLLTASTDAINRKILRDLNVGEELVKVIGLPELCDLHIISAAVLANLLPDLETLKMMITDGSLHKLTELITDAPRPVTLELPVPGKESKESPPSKDKKAPEKPESKKQEKAPKPGKKTKGAEAEEVKSVPQQFVIIEVYPEVKEYIAQAFCKGAKNAEYRHCLNDIEMEKVLVILLSSPYASVRIAAAQAVTVMSENLVSRDAFGLHGAVQKLTCMAANTLQGDMEENSENSEECENNDRNSKLDSNKDGDKLRDLLQTSAISALLIVTEMSDINCRELVDSNGIHTLLTLLADSKSSARLQSDCMTILRNLSAIMESISAANSCEARRSVIASICAILANSKKSSIHVHAICTLCQFVQKPSDKHLLLVNEGVKALVDILSADDDDDSTEIDNRVATAVTYFANCPSIAEQFVCLGGLELLRGILDSDELPSPSVKSAYKTILNNYLPAKFALLGVLCDNDMTCSGFYDRGRVTSCDKFPPLILGAENKNEKLRPSRIPTYLAFYQCTCRQCSAYQCCDIQSNECGEVCLASCVDQALVNDIYIMSQAMCTIPCPIERIQTLAKYVACKMGGAMEENKMRDFDWQLSLSKLRLRLQTDVIPLGAVTKGIYYHRALLFKVIGDRIGIRSKLVRGCDCYRAWVEVLVDISQPQCVPNCHIVMRSADQFESTTCRLVVDLMHCPGRLLPGGSLETLRYTGAVPSS